MVDSILSWSGREPGAGVRSEVIYLPFHSSRSPSIELLIFVVHCFLPSFLLSPSRYSGPGFVRQLLAVNGADASIRGVLGRESPSHRERVLLAPSMFLLYLFTEAKPTPQQLTATPHS